LYAEYSVYGLGVPGDHPGTPEKDGGVDGDTIVFRIGDLTADQRGTFNGGSNEHLDLTASTSVEYGSITLVKQTNPDGGTGFDFSGDLGGCSLDDRDSETFSSLPPGSYDVTEDVPAGWDLDGVVCTGGDSARITDGVTVELDEGEDVTCVFTNVERGSILIVKETDPPGAAGFEFIGDLGSFALDDGGSRVFGDLVSGDYDVTEALSAGWDLDDVVCTGGDSTVAANGVTVHLDPGKDVVCTFSNVGRGSIMVVKETEPDGGVGFDFSGDLGDFSLDDGDSETFDALLPGDHGVTEVVPAGWDLDGVVCTGGDSTPIGNGVQIHLGAGESLTCTFTNIQYRCYIPLLFRN
jgi:hypothetical protein